MRFTWKTSFKMNIWPSQFRLMVRAEQACVHLKKITYNSDVHFWLRITLRFSSYEKYIILHINQSIQIHYTCIYITARFGNLVFSQFKIIMTDIFPLKILNNLFCEYKMHRIYQK